MAEHGIYEEIRVELERARELHGNQDHLPGVDQALLSREGGCTAGRMAEEYEIPSATRAKFLCDYAARWGECTWAHILVEELSEAIEAATEGDTENLRTELVQVGAMVVGWIESLDSNLGGK